RRRRRPRPHRGGHAGHGRRRPDRRGRGRPVLRPLLHRPRVDLRPFGAPPPGGAPSRRGAYGGCWSAGSAPGRLRAAAGAGGPPRLDRPLWRALGGAGFFALRLPEGDGGVGLGLPEAVPAFEEAGRALLPGPLIATHLAAGTVRGAATGGTVVAAVDGGPVERRAEADVVLGDPAGAEPMRSLDPLTPLHRIRGGRPPPVPWRWCSPPPSSWAPRRWCASRRRNTPGPANSSGGPSELSRRSPTCVRACWCAPGRPAPRSARPPSPPTRWTSPPPGCSPTGPPCAPRGTASRCTAAWFSPGSRRSTAPRARLDPDPPCGRRHGEGGTAGGGSARRRRLNGAPASAVPRLRRAMGREISRIVASGGHAALIPSCALRGTRHGLSPGIRSGTLCGMRVVMSTHRTGVALGAAPDPLVSAPARRLAGLVAAACSTPRAGRRTVCPTGTPSRWNMPEALVGV